MRAAYLKMTLATALLGSYLVASKIILREVPVFTATFVRLVSASVVLAVYVGAKYRGVRWERPSRRDGTVILAQSLLGVFLFSVFAMYGVKYTGAIESGVVLGMVPISMSFVALVFLKESMTSRRVMGIAVAVVGAVGINVLASRSSGGEAGSNVALGSLLLVCAVLCEAVFMTFGKLLTRPIPPAKLSLLLSVTGALLFLVPAGFEFHGVLHSHISWQTWALMVYTGVAINGLAVVLMYDSMDSVDVTVASAFTAMTPVSGAILSVLFIGEALHTYHVVGMLLVVTGVFIVAREARSGASSAPKPADLPPVRVHHAGGSADSSSTVRVRLRP
ncbi:DMT family transporter [Streptomyces sp. NPDC059373]